jgi:hypothetical protein
VSSLGSSATLAGTLTDLHDVAGWLSDEQAARLWQAAARVPQGGSIVEIGSFRGRSAIVLARAATADVSIDAIDPHGGGDRGPNEISPDQGRGDADNAAFMANLRAAGVADRVRHLRKPSAMALQDIAADVDLVYIDGAHRYRPARDDIAAYGARVRHGGTLLVHDSFNAIGVTLALLRLLVGGRLFRYVGRTASLAEYRRSDLRGPARLVSLLRQIGQLGYFLRMLTVKAALTLRAYPVARLLGHPSRDWPF